MIRCLREISSLLINIYMVLLFLYIYYYKENMNNSDEYMKSKAMGIGDWGFPTRTSMKSSSTMLIFRESDRDIRANIQINLLHISHSKTTNSQTVSEPSKENGTVTSST